MAVEVTLSSDGKGLISIQPMSLSFSFYIHSHCLATGCTVTVLELNVTVQIELYNSYNKHRIESEMVFVHPYIYSFIMMQGASATL